MNQETGSLSQSVRLRLQEGAAPQQVVEDLVDRGLSRSTAQRFVDRALAEATPETWVPYEPIPTVRPRDSAVGLSLQDRMYAPVSMARAAAHHDLLRGAGLASLGIAATVVSPWLPGRSRVWWGLIVVGTFLFGRGMKRCGDLPEPFPWGRVLLTGAMPPGVLVFAIALSVAASMWATPKATRAEAASAVAPAAGVSTEVTFETATRQLQSSSSASACTAAAWLARSGSREAVAPLSELLQRAPNAYVQQCAADALARLGALPSGR